MPKLRQSSDLLLEHHVERELREDADVHVDTLQLAEDFDDLIWREKLNLRQQRFVEEYCIDLDAHRAALRAGYAKSCAKSHGCRNLRHPVISFGIYHRLKYVSSMLKTRILHELGNIAFSSPKEVMSWDDDGVYLKCSDELTDEQARVIQEIRFSKTLHGNNIKVKFSDKQAAIEKLGKALKMWVDKHEVEEIGAGKMNVKVQVVGSDGNGNLPVKGKPAEAVLPEGVLFTSGVDMEPLSDEDDDFDNGFDD